MTAMCYLSTANNNQQHEKSQTIDAQTSVTLVSSAPLYANKNHPMILRQFSSLFAMLLVFTACNHSSAVDLQNEKEVLKALATTWETKYMETRGTRNKVPDNMITQLVLKENGTYSVGVKNGVIKQNGQWHYDPKSQILSWGQRAKKGTSRIVKLTSKELINSEFMTSNGEVMDSIVTTYIRL